METASGLYVIAGDTVPHFENMEVPAGEPFWPTGIYIDLEGALRKPPQAEEPRGFHSPRP